MAKKQQTLAEKIVEAVLKNLKGRSGIGDALEGCDRGIQREIQKELTQDVQSILTEELHKS